MKILICDATLKQEYTDLFFHKISIFEDTEISFEEFSKLKDVMLEKYYKFQEKYSKNLEKELLQDTIKPKNNAISLSEARSIAIAEIAQAEKERIECSEKEAKQSDFLDKTYNKGESKMKDIMKDIIKRGCIARCSKGFIGLVTSDSKIDTKLGHKAWIGIHLDPEMAGYQWCSRDPEFIADSFNDIRSKLESINRKYEELIFQVEQKFPNESRHDTALRYIRDFENRRSEPGEKTSGA